MSPLARLSLAFAIAAAPALGACSSDEPKKADPPPTTSTDAGAAVTPPAHTDAGPLAAPDAGPPASADAGPSGDAGAAAASAQPPDAPRAKSSAFDRVLAKPKDAGVSHGDVKSKVERATGAKVQSMKKSARTWLLIEFAPTAPPRTAEKQRALIDAMEGTGLFSAIEGDRMMQVK